MAWTSYTDNLMKQDKFVAVAICGVAGGLWASNPPSFNLTDPEVVAIVGGMKNPSGVQANGVYANGTKFMYIKSEPKFLYANKGKVGLACARSKKCVIIGKHGEHQGSGNASEAVTKMAQYLEDAGY